MIDVQVRTELGDVVARGSCSLDWMASLRHVDENQFPLLGSLLPYADTMFNSRQVGRLQRELASDRIRALLGDESVAELERLCAQVLSGSHLYLWFLGD